MKVVEGQNSVVGASGAGFGPRLTIVLEGGHFLGNLYSLICLEAKPNAGRRDLPELLKKQAF